MEFLKKLLLCAGFLALFAGAAVGDARADATQGSTSIELEIVVGNGRGRVLCGVYEKAGWLRRPLHAASASIRGGVAVCRFNDLRPGVYAAGAFQDENLNGKLDRRWTGMPSEPWCVSRESRGTIGAPSFSSAAFSVGTAPVHLRCRAK